MTEFTFACLLAVVAACFVFGLRSKPLPEDTYERPQHLIVSFNGSHRVLEHPQVGPPIPFAGCDIENDERSMRRLILPFATQVASVADGLRQLDVLGPWGNASLGKPFIFTVDASVGTYDEVRRAL